MPRSDDAVTALNEVLNDVIDIVQEVKQAHRKVPETHALHAALDQLFDDLRSWAQLIIERDDALGQSPLGQVPTAAGRKPANLWPGAASDEEVRLLIGEHLDRLAQHVTAALSAQDDALTRSGLADIQRGLLANRNKLAEL
ncbi:MAG: starvation-inducible DNA-binding protein [Actinomycetota bacterium]